MIDWQDEFFRLAPIQNYQLSVSNGNKNSKYRLSLGYIDQQGVAIETSYKRLNLRANVESRLFDRITMGFNIAPTMTWNEGGSIEGKDQQAQKVLSMCPIAEPEAGVPLPSPTTTKAVKRKLRPPLTTFVTRLIDTTFSSSSNWLASIIVCFIFGNRENRKSELFQIDNARLPLTLSFANNQICDFKFEE